MTVFRGALVPACALACLTVAAGNGPLASPGSRSAECGPTFGPVRDTGEVVLVGTPLGDTLAASTGDPVMFGQLVEPSRVSSPGLPQGTERVLLVPWGFTADCQPLPWTGGWAWAASGEEGFFRGRLRPEAEWASGVPTLDVPGAVWEGHPRSAWRPPGAAGRRLLSAAQLFDLYGLLPTEDEYGERPYGSVAGIVQWRRTNPEMVDAYPAWQILRSAFAEAENARLRGDPLAYGGTYHLYLEVDADTIAEFFVRTAGVARAAPRGAADDSDLPLTPEPSAKLLVGVDLAGSETDLTDRSRLAAACSRLDGLTVVPDDEREEGQPTWRAALKLGAITTCFDDDALRLLAPAPDDGSHFGGSFRRQADGRYTFTQRITSSLGPGRITGERVDALTISGEDEAG